MRWPEVMVSMEPSSGLSMLGEGVQGHRHAGEATEGEDHTCGSRERDDVMRLVSGKERPRGTVHTGRISTL